MSWIVAVAEAQHSNEPVCIRTARSQANVSGLRLR
jgi:hypothetical protein